MARGAVKGAGLATGNYTVSATRFDYAVTPSFTNPVTVGPSATGKNFTAIVSNTSAPTISVIADVVTDEDTPTPDISFTIGDAQTSAGTLLISHSSSNHTLLPDENVVIAGTDVNETVTLAPVADQTGTSTVTITVSDGTFSACRWFLFTVNPVNDAPLAMNDSYTTHGTIAVAGPGVLTNDADVEGDATTAALVHGPLNGSLTLNADGSFLYAPRLGFVGIDGFVYTANDGATSNAATVTIAVQHSQSDFDGDADLADFAIFRNCFNGSNRPPACP